MPITVHELLTLTRLTLALGEVERVPTHPDGKRRETDTTHSVMLALTAATVASRIGLDPGKACLLALLHDLPEVYAGDVDTSLGLSAEARAAKASRERAALLRIHRELGSLSLLREGLAEYEAMESQEAEVVHLLDKMMPKLVRIVGVQDGDQPVPGRELRLAAVRQLARLEQEHPSLASLHNLSWEVLAELFYGQDLGRDLAGEPVRRVS